MSEEQVTILACVPANEEDRMGIPYDGPNPGSVVSQCEGCGMDIWYGPKQKAMKEQHPEVPVLCMLCVFKKRRRHSLQHWESDRDGKIRL